MAVLGLSLILFIKLELFWRCFVPLSNSKFYFVKLRIDLMLYAAFNIALHLT